MREHLKSVPRDRHSWYNYIICNTQGKDEADMVDEQFKSVVKAQIEAQSTVLDGEAQTTGKPMLKRQSSLQKAFSFMGKK
jgi:hypothetical protein